MMISLNVDAGIVYVYNCVVPDEGAR